MIRLVLFDIDGTLINSGGAGEKAFARVFANFFGVPNGTEKLRFAGRTDLGILREFFVQNAIEPSPENTARFFDAYIFLLGHMLQNLPGRVLPGVWPWLHDLHSLPHQPTIGLLTGNVRLGAEIKLRHFHLWEQFATGGFADDSAERNGIAVAAKERGEAVLGRKLHGEEILVIGDTPHDISCGRHIGAKVLAVGTGMFGTKELRTFQPDWAVDHLDQVSATELCG